MGGKKSPAPRERNPWKNDFDPPHKQVDFNDMCLAIMEYAKEQEAEASAGEGPKYYYKAEAAKDIIALLHTRL
jgi:hypothetical protein